MLINKYKLLLPTIALLLSGCASSPSQGPTATGVLAGAVGGGLVGSAVSVGVGTAVGVATGAVLGILLSKQRTLVEELQSYGVLFFEVGDQITIVIPADVLFLPRSPMWNTKAFYILSKVIILVNRYEKLSVKVAAYTDSLGSPIRNKALSRQWAEDISHYFWKNGMDVRLLYAIGYGCEDSVATNQTAEGRKANRRIEISLTEVEVPV